MINKIIIDGKNVELTDASQLPFMHTFQQAKTHEVKFGLDKTDEICAYAFKDCVNLTKIELPDTIKMIKRGAFKNCSRLPKITLSEHINYIGKEAFDGCTSLTDIIYEGTEVPSTYFKLPEQTTWYVPDDSKYEKIADNDTIDTSGDIEYFTKTAWNQYEPVYDLSEIDSETEYYRNKWDSIGNNIQVKENKNRRPVERIVLVSSDTVSIGARVNDKYTLTYFIYPEDCTNHNLKWFTRTDDIELDDLDEPGYITVKMLKENLQGTAVLTCYAESGIRQSVTFRIQPAATPEP